MFRSFCRALWLVRRDHAVGASTESCASLLLVVVATACASDDDPISIVRLSGGDTTTLNRSAGTFETPALNLTEQQRTLHFAGDNTFGTLFQPPPATVNAGLGPRFNHVSCDSCHVRNGRGSPTMDAAAEGSRMLIRVSHPGRDPSTGGPVAVPGLGDQLQDHAIAGTTPEARTDVTWQPVQGRFDDGTAYTLRRPQRTITLANGSLLDSNILTSPRLAPPVFGLGLLEALSDAEILAHADPDDSDGDGISGRPNYVWSLSEQRKVLGRFGWKANTPDLRQQAAAAYFNDVGVSNPLFLDADGARDIDEAILGATTFYTQSLAVPVRATLDEQSTRGARLFFQASCANCHRPNFVTASHPLEALSQQLIAPYTDLLLHDLGEDLADHRPDFEATGSEWRTSPLWGIGLSTTVLGEGAFLHDGRARTLEEAILWHGGEAQFARDSYKRMPKRDREALVEFLQAL